MKPEVLLYWKQHGSVLLFVAGPVLALGKQLDMGFDGNPKFRYEVVAVYERFGPLDLLEKFHMVWEPLYDAKILASVRENIPKIRAREDCWAYLLKVVGVVKAAESLPGTPDKNFNPLMN